MGGELDKSKNNNSNDPQDRIPIKYNLSHTHTLDFHSPKSKLEKVNYKLTGRFSLRPVDKKNRADEELINNSLENNYFFRNLKGNEKKDVVINMNLTHFNANSIICSAGSNSNFWYIVRKGDLELNINNKKIKELKKEDSFGESGPLNSAPQNATVKAITDCELWGLTKDIFDKIKEILIKSSIKENSDFLKTLTIPIKDNIKTDMANYLVKYIYKPNEVIRYEGEIIPCIYIIKDGEVNVNKNNKILKTYKRKEFFGEEGLFEGYKNTANIIAKTNCIIYSISNEFFYKHFGKGKDFKNQLYFTLLKIIFSKSSYFSKINSHLNDVFDCFKIKTYKNNIPIYRKGTDVSKKMCIILNGNIFERGAIIGGKYEILFEKELSKENQIIVADDLVCDSYCVIAEANYDDIKKELDKNNSDNRLKNNNSFFSSNSNKASIQNTSRNIARYLLNRTVLNKNNNNNNNFAARPRIKSDAGMRNFTSAEPYRKDRSLKDLSLRKQSGSPKVDKDSSFSNKKNSINFNYNSRFHINSNNNSNSNINNVNRIPIPKNPIGLRSHYSPNRGILRSTKTLDEQKQFGLRYTKTINEPDSNNKFNLLRMDHTLNSSHHNNAFNRVAIIPEEIKTNAISEEEINKIEIFRKVDDSKKKILQNNLEIEKYNDGSNILEQGKNGNNLYVIKKGKVDVYLNSKYVKTKKEGDNFGYDTLITNNTTNLQTVTAKGDVECYTLTKEIFNKILNKELKDYFLQRFYLNDYSIELEDLEYVKSLGEGSYGFVNLVRNIRTKYLYAAKALILKQIKEENILLRTECERNLLLKMDHPFIANCVKFLKHDVYLLYIMEYVQGKELFDVMREINLFNKLQTQFYAASMLEVIYYLHKHKIIYRDLKPENVMIKENGYVKFIDFGTVKELKDKTKTFLGTYSYMAPEIFEGNGYSFQVDMWALGVIMYEFVCGKLPFGDDFDDEENPMKFYNILIKENLKFPSFLKDEQFKDLIQKMLVKDVNKRLVQYTKIREHPYFKDFDWDKLLSLQLRGPYIFKLHNAINKNKKTKPYSDYLNGLNRRPYFKKMVSNRQIRFQKWYDNF